MDNGATPGARDKDKWTALHVAVLKQQTAVVELLVERVEGGERIVEQLTLHLQDQNTRHWLEEIAEAKSEGSTVVRGLRLAANSGHVERVLALLETGVDIDAEDSIEGSTALTLATWFSYEDVALALLENGADVNKPNGNGWTALHIAARDGYSGMVEMLVENGADLEARIHGWTPLLLAARSLRERLAHPSIVRYLLAQGADVHAGDYHDRRALHWAAQVGDISLVSLLLDEGAHPNVADRWGRTPLMWAVDKGRHLAIEILLRSGADVVAAAKDGSTALHIAAYNGDATAVARLVTSGANRAAQAQGGLTPLHIATFMGYRSVVSLLGDGELADRRDSKWCVETRAIEGSNDDDIVNIDTVEELLCSRFSRAVAEDSVGFGGERLVNTGSGGHIKQEEET